MTLQDRNFYHQQQTIPQKESLFRSQWPNGDWVSLEQIDQALFSFEPANPQTRSEHFSTNATQTSK